MYTKDEVFIIWQDGKYLKKRGKKKSITIRFGLWYNQNTKQRKKP